MDPILAAAQNTMPGPALSGMWSTSTPPPSGPDLLPFMLIVIAYAITLSALLLLFLAQVSLVATCRTHLRRYGGIAAAAMAGTGFVAAYFAAITSARQGGDIMGALSLLPPVPGITAEASTIIVGIVVLLFLWILFGASLHLPTSDAGRDAIRLEWFFDGTSVRPLTGVPAPRRLHLREATTTHALRGDDIHHTSSHK